MEGLGNYKKTQKGEYLMGEEKKKDFQDVIEALEQLDETGLMIIRIKAEALRDRAELERQNKPA